LHAVILAHSTLYWCTVTQLFLRVVILARSYSCGAVILARSYSCAQLFLRVVIPARSYSCTQLFLHAVILARSYSCAQHPLLVHSHAVILARSYSCGAVILARSTLYWCTVTQLFLHAVILAGKLFLRAAPFIGAQSRSYSCT
jgi:hypothetical protein